MNIAIFTNNYLPNPYGVSTSVETFRYEFEKRGHTVYIFAPEYPGYKNTNPKVFLYPSVDMKLKIFFPLAIPYSRDINKVLEKFDIDVIHSQHPNLLGMAAVHWAKKKKIPLIFTWHTLYEHYVHFVKFIPRKLAIWYVIKNAVKYANKANAVIVPTDSIIPIIKNHGVTNNNISAIATGVIEEDFENPERKIIREKYAITDDETLLLMVARLTPEKNVNFVFRSVVDVLKKDKKVKFIVVSDGYLMSDLKKYVESEKVGERVIFAGVISRKEIKNYFSAGDIFVYGSKSETQGMILTEAMYAGLPIVAVDATGTKSLVINNGNGFLVREDENEFSEAILKLKNNSELSRKFGETSARIARTNFTASVCAEKMLSVYEKLLRH